MTYSIIGRDPGTGEVGIAVQSRWFHAPQDLAWIEPEVGAVSTQALLEPTYRGARRATCSPARAAGAAWSMPSKRPRALSPSGCSPRSRRPSAKARDARGKQAAGILVRPPRRSGVPWQDRVLELRVVDHPAPVPEVRLFDVKRAYDASRRFRSPVRGNFQLRPTGPDPSGFYRVSAPVPARVERPTDLLR